MIAHDKIKHVAAGALVALVALALWLALTAAGFVDPRGGPVCALISGALQGLSKEGADWLRRRADIKAGVLGSTHPDPWDFVATLAGAVLVAGGAGWWLW